MGVSRDTGEFAEFFASSWDPCLRAVVATTGHWKLAEDQTAEAFARAWASWSTVRRHPAPKAWVVRTALNTGATWWHRRHRETALTGHDAPASETQATPETGLDAALIEAVRRLPARQREVVVLRIFLDLDIETTAQHLGTAPGTVRAHLSRAMTTLRNQYTPTTTSTEMTL